MNQREIYVRLGLKDPEKFRLWALANFISKNSHTLYHEVLFKEFMQERHTGKTTRKLASAISAALSGKIVIYQARNRGQIKYTISKLREMLSGLNLDYSSFKYDINYLQFINGSIRFEISENPIAGYQFGKHTILIKDLD